MPPFVIFSNAIDRHWSEVIVRIVGPIIANPSYPMYAFSNLRSDAEPALTSELIDHDGRRRLALWIVEDMTVIGTERRLKRGKHSDSAPGMSYPFGSRRRRNGPLMSVSDRTE